MDRLKLSMISIIAGAGLCALQTQAAPLVLESPASRVSVLELYTSEGCSSCPAADRWLSGLKDDSRLWKEVVPVAFHVDYWDYIGWADRFASPLFTERQRSHAAARGWRTVYTPGLVLAGEEWRGWFKRPTLQLDAGPETGTLRISVAGQGLSGEFTPAAGLAGDLELHVAVLGFGLATEVRAGENGGRTLEHDFVVLGYGRTPMRADQGRYEAQTSMPAPVARAPRLGLAAWISSASDPRPLQAVGGWLEN